MKKIIILAAVLILTALLLAAGCSQPASPESTPEDKSNESKTKVLEEYEVWENEGTFPGELPEGMREVIHKLKKDRGYFIFNPQKFSTGKDLYILVSSGEKRTGGYSIIVKNITVKNETLEITVEEKKPLQENTVIQVLTYPVMLLKVKNDYTFFDITNTDGEAFLPIFPEESPANDHKAAGSENVLHSAGGTLVGRIDSNSVEIEINGEPQAFYLSEQTLIDNFKDGEKILFDYYEDQYGRLMINKLEKGN